MQQQTTFPAMTTADTAAAKPAPTWAVRSVKLAAFAVMTGGNTAAAYLILPTLGRSGVWGYWAGFLMQAITAASIIVPVPWLAALTVMAQELNPVTLALTGAAGGALGELTGYWLGAQGRGLLHRTRPFEWVRSQMHRRGGLIIVLFAAVPVLPMDTAGLMAGAVRYPVARFLLSMFVGKLLLLLATFLAARGLLSLFLIA